MRPLPLLIDPAGRVIDYLRLSVTDACQIHCLYCRDPGIGRLADRPLSDEHLETFVQACLGLGLRTVRITGGEPTLRHGLVPLMARLRELDAGLDLALTTNGLTLAKRDLAAGLKSAGLDRINISIDSTDPDVFATITRGGRLQDCLDGIHAALDAGLHPVKLNAVLLAGVNDDVRGLLQLTYDLPVHVRFIEYMTFPIRDVPEYRPMDEITPQLLEFGEPEPVGGPPGAGPATYVRLPGAQGTVGFIDPRRREHFCAACRRIRLTPDGQLRLCLFGDVEYDVRGVLESGGGVPELQELIRQAVADKPDDFFVSTGAIQRTFSQIGG